MVFCEVGYGKAGLQGCGFLENRLRIADFQTALEEGEVKHFLVADHVQTEKSFQLESSKCGGSAAKNLTDADHAIVLGGTGIGAEIDVVVDCGVFDSGMDELVLPMKIHGQIGGGMEIVFPTEMIGVVLGLEPGGGLALQVDVKGQYEVFEWIVIIFSKSLPPLSPKVEISNLIT